MFVNAEKSSIIIIKKKTRIAALGKRGEEFDDESAAQPQTVKNSDTLLPGARKRETRSRQIKLVAAAAGIVKIQFPRTLDESPSFGGEGEGPSPSVLLSLSMGNEGKGKNGRRRTDGEQNKKTGDGRRREAVPLKRRGKGDPPSLRP